MAGNYAWFSYVNRVEAATITADSEVESLPVTNIANRLNHKFFRSESETVTISLDFGAAVTWQQITLQFIAHRDPASAAVDEIDPTDEITIEASNVAAGDAELLNATVDCNVIRERGYFQYVAASEITGRYLDITIDAASRSALGYVNVGFAHVGPIFQPTANYNIGATLDFEEESLINVSPTTGASYVESRGRLLGFSGVWGLITEAELALWEAFQEKTGITKPIAFGLGTTGNLGRKGMIARFNQPIRFSLGQARLASARVSLIENR